MTDANKVIGYRAGQGRDDLGNKSHTYAMMENGDLWPMCIYGWNRSNGDRYSIFRRTPGTEGDCGHCRRNVKAGRAPLIDGAPHKTRYM